MKKDLIRLITFTLTAFILITTVSAAPRDEAEPGAAYNIIYYEEFNYENTSGNAKVAELLGWKELSLDDKTAVTNGTASYSIKDGRLYVENNKSGATDSYIMIANDAKMMSAWMYDYTLQFDLTLTSAGNNSRYIALLTDYKESTTGYYHSFHLRINGSANSQARMNGTWLTFDAPGDYYAADVDDTDGTSTISKKILGKDYDGSHVLTNINLTIRIVNEKCDIGPRVYIRNNTDGGPFVLVSIADIEGDAGTSWRSTGGKAIVLKAGGAVNGYVDNIVVYKGTGEPVWEEIKLPETTVEPDSTEAPATEEPEISTEITEKAHDSGCASMTGASGIILIAIAAATVLKKRR